MNCEQQFVQTDAVDEAIQAKTLFKKGLKVTATKLSRPGLEPGPIVGKGPGSGPGPLRVLRRDHRTSMFLNCQGSFLSISSGKNPGRPSSGVQSV